MVNDVIQFTENHKWSGSLGIITERLICNDPKSNSTDVRYQIAVPIPQQGTAYIYVMESENAFEFIGKAVLIPKD